MTLIKRSDGSSQILSPDGSLYMHLPPPRPGRSDMIGYRVRTIASGSHNGSCAARGTRSTLTDDCMSERDLLRLIGSLRTDYGAPVVSGVRMGSGRSFRWAWEDNTGGHRFSDVVIATRI